MKHLIKRCLDGLSAMSQIFVDAVGALLNGIADVTSEFIKILAQSMGVISDAISNNILTEIVSTAVDKQLNLSLQKELHEKSEKLNALDKYIEDKEKDAMRFELLATVGKEQINALTTEIRNNLREELDRGKNKKRVLKFLGWLTTLVLGGIVGALISNFI